METTNNSAKRGPDSTMDTPEGNQKKRRATIELLENDEYTDVELTCQGRVWKLHRAVLCQESPWFDKALNGRFVESSGKIKIEEFEPGRIDRLIDYIYGERPYSTPSPPRITPPGHHTVTPDRFAGDHSFIYFFKLWQISDYFLINTWSTELLERSRKLLQDASRDILRLYPREGNAGNVLPDLFPPNEPEDILKISEILYHFREAVYYVYENHNMDVFKSQLAVCYIQGIFRCHEDPVWELDTFIEKEFAVEILRQMGKVGGEIRLLGIPRTCGICQQPIPETSSNSANQWQLCSGITSYTKSNEVISGWGHEFRIICNSCIQESVDWGYCY